MKAQTNKKGVAQKNNEGDEERTSFLALVLSWEVGNKVALSWSHLLVLQCCTCRTCTETFTAPSESRFAAFVRSLTKEARCSLHGSRENQDRDNYVFRSWHGSPFPISSPHCNVSRSTHTNKALNNLLLRNWMRSCPAFADLWCEPERSMPSIYSNSESPAAFPQSLSVPLRRPYRPQTCPPSEN